MVSMIDQNDEQILYTTFNQDQGCFAIGTETGFRVYNTHPLLEAFSRDLGGGIGIVEMLYRCNILALVGGGKNPKYPKNKVMLWDDHQTKIIGEMSFRSEVMAVRLRTNRVVVVLENKIFVYNFADLRLLDQIETYSNPRGLCTMNTEGEYSILACPDSLLGHVFISHYEQKKQIKIKAHQSTLSWIELNSKGTKIATTSEKGTVIRIYETSEGKMIQELRRGTEYAQIQSLSFDPTGRWIACSSDSGTIHIFCLKLNEIEKQELEKKEAELKEKKMEIKNPKSKFQFMKVMIPYLNQERSFSQFRIKDLYSKVAFGNDPCIIIVISTQGNYYLAQFDPINGGEAIQQMISKMFAQGNTKVNDVKKDEEKFK